MTGGELLHLLVRQRSNRHRFIKWWRNNEGICDIEMIDTFFDRAKVGDQFDGFELLDMEDMWVIVRQHSGESVQRSHQDNGEIVTWEQVDPDGKRQKTTSRLTPELLIKVFEAEGGGHKVDK